VPSKLTPALQANLKDGALVLDPILQISIPPRCFAGLINAVQRQLKSFEQHYGPIEKAAEAAKEK
jgi:hypothetical protein